MLKIKRCPTRKLKSEWKTALQKVDQLAFRIINKYFINDKVYFVVKIYFNKTSVKEGGGIVILNLAILQFSDVVLMFLSFWVYIYMENDKKIS